MWGISTEVWGTPQERKEKGQRSEKQLLCRQAEQSAL